VDFDVTVRERYDIEAAREQFETGENMTYEQIGALMASGEIEEDELAELASLARKRGVGPHTSGPDDPPIPGNPTRADLVDHGASIRIYDSERGRGLIYDLTEENREQQGSSDPEDSDAGSDATGN
jgi:hypothetical protein